MLTANVVVLPLTALPPPLFHTYFLLEDYCFTDSFASLHTAEYRTQVSKPVVSLSTGIQLLPVTTTLPSTRKITSLLSDPYSKPMLVLQNYFEHVIPSRWLLTFSWCFTDSLAQAYRSPSYSHTLIFLPTTSSHLLLLYHLSHQQHIHAHQVWQKCFPQKIFREYLRNNREPSCCIVVPSIKERRCQHAKY